MRIWEIIANGIPGNPPPEPTSKTISLSLKYYFTD